MARNFENVCEIISNFKKQVKAQKKLAGAIYKEESLEKQRQKELFTT